MPFAAGSFSFPTSTGAYSVAGLGFKPQLVVMFGSNRPEEDVLVTGLTRPGLFLSINCVDWAVPATIRSFCLSIAGSTQSSIVGYARSELPVRMQNNVGASGIDYRADAISFGADGFTLNVTHAAPANRPIHWWALAHPEGQVASVLAESINGNFDPGFRGKSFIGLNGPGTGTEGQTDNDSWLHFGTNHYPGDATSPDTRVAGESHTGIQLTSPVGRQGFTEEFLYTGVPANRVCHAVSALGPGIFSTYKTAEPVALGASEVTLTGTGVPDQTIIAWFNGEGDADLLATPVTVGQTVSVSVPTWFDLFELVMFSTVNGPNVQVSFSQLRYGLGVLHPDYQGCVVIGDDGSFYQSRTKMAATCTALGANTASGVILGPTFEATTEAGGRVQGVYHGFGPLEAGWIPQMYRWQGLRGKTIRT